MFDDFFDTEPSSTEQRSTGRATSSTTAAVAVGEPLRLARQHARLSLRDAADQIGITRGYLSKAEHGHVVPSWEVLVRIAAAYGREPRLRLLSIQDDLAAKARAMVAKTPLQRLGGQEQQPAEALDRLAEGGVAFVVDGAAAAVLQGLPMTIDAMTVLVRDDDENLTALVQTLRDAHLLFREFEPDEMRGQCGRSWSLGWCDVRFDLVPELPDAVELPIGRRTIRVLPLTVLVARDSDVADVFRAVQTVLAG